MSTVYVCLFVSRCAVQKKLKQKKKIPGSILQSDILMKTAFFDSAYMATHLHCKLHIKVLKVH